MHYILYNTYMNLCEYLYSLFKSFMDYLFFGETKDEYQEYNENKNAINSPLHPSNFETHHVYPCQETF